MESESDVKKAFEKSIKEFMARSEEKVEVHPVQVTVPDSPPQK